VANGFTTGLSFYYSSEHGAAADIYTGLDATGTILATLDLPGNNEGSGGFGGADCFFTAYCPYTATGIAFAGTAYSVDFVQGDRGCGHQFRGVVGSCPRHSPTLRHRPRSDGLACVAQKENGT
jgi:hypothetical protein